MRDFDASQFTLVRKGNTYSDFAVGQVFEHHWGRTFTEDDNVLFSTATCAWVPMYINREFARGHGHPDFVINPMLLLCTIVGLSVEDLSEGGGGPFLGLGNCEFRLPCYPGDTVRARSIVLAKRISNSRPGWGTVTWQTEALNQTNQKVLTFERSNLVKAPRRPTLSADIVPQSS